jgi:hypothetical protein
MKVLDKNIILLLILSLITTLQGLTQTPQLNEDKYWAYRERLRHEYMIGIGPGVGMSIPASIRDTASGILQWTDCTMAHGEYMAILGMEYKILEDRSDELDQTIKELYYALYALNRLDYTAEIFFGGAPSLNGFFMRDDIAEDSLDMDTVLAHLNQGLSVFEITHLDSDFMDEIPRNNEESLDQAILLVTGLSVIRKCVPEDVVYTIDGEAQQFQDFETSLSLEAGNIITRIVNYMKEGDSITVQLDPDDPNLYGIQGNAWDFIIKNPVTLVEVLRGSNAYFLSKGYTSAKYHATGLFSPTTDLTADSITDSVFIALENFILPNDQDFKVINLNAMANFWPDGLQEDTTNTDYNARVLGPRSQQQYYEWIPMLHQVMFGGENNYLRSEVPPDTVFYDDPEGYYEYLLNLAPPEGPYNYENGFYPNYEWSSTSRTIQPDRRGDKTTPFKGHYPGLGYMIYYNMFTLLFNGPVFMEEEVAYSFNIYPNPFSGKIHIDIPAGYDAFDYRLRDIHGRQIKSGQINGSNSCLILNNLPAGIYLLSIDNGSIVFTKKLIKQ